MDSPFIIHVLTAPSEDADVAFESRMFAPAASVPEDPVCGTAHTLSVPYWTAKNGLHAKVEGEGILARQVSARGGELRDGLVQVGRGEQLNEGTVGVLSSRDTIVEPGMPR